MAFRKARVETAPELKTIAEQLKSKYPVAFEDLDPERVVYLKSDARSKRSVKLTPIKVPHPTVTPYKFSLMVYSQQFDQLSKAHQIMHIFRELRRIDDFEEGKTSDYPLKDFPDIVEKFGVLWEEDENLPNILVEKEE